MAETEHALLELDSDQRAFLDAVHAFARNEVAPRARRIDADDTFDPGLVSKAAQLGLQGMVFDDDGALDPEGYVLAHETTELLASYSGAAALAVGVARLHAHLLNRFAGPEARERWLPGLLDGTGFGCFCITEPHAGSDVRGMRTTAAADGDDYVLSGEKAFITQAPVARFGIVLAKLEHTERDADMRAFVVDFDQQGVQVGGPEPMLGFRGVPMASVVFDGARVPAANALAVDGFAGMFEGVNLARLDAAAYALGFIRGALRECTEYLRERESFGKPLDRHQLVQGALGEMFADYLAARELTLSAVRGFSAGQGGDATLISAAKLTATEAAMRCTSKAVDLLGGSGVHLDYAVQRFFRDAKITQIIDGTSGIQTLMLGRAAAGLDWSRSVPARPPS
ncbi:alkylation response protein AidB-like acyl-CoA dehydrogenase [Haloactinopolyspora alba]|uniref:Alkylation response protein AidB-like acyl-CoA dehydrogenase n=1 Tax=Haloactinopolyspora alba TaxID=648780 RepID=A0A2P8E9H2_9ACTN|nr:acyl-CoA dehydrogenase family protein [Haloactinopolyspora alba]PSL06126.1 alkylation response protein AidB-like acyl-CoA dehydrogenase [Haloactinopolyspora alba]